MFFWSSGEPAGPREGSAGCAGEGGERVLVRQLAQDGDDAFNADTN